MRQAFEAWAQRDGHIVRRREDKPEEYLVYETQRRWLIWQAALAHGQKAAAEAPQKFAPSENQPQKMQADEASPQLAFELRVGARRMVGENLLRLTLIRNAGAAFSIGNQATWLFTLVSLAILVSAAVSLTLIPMLGARFLHRTKADDPSLRWTAWWDPFRGPRMSPGSRRTARSGWPGPGHYR